MICAPECPAEALVEAEEQMREEIQIRGVARQIQHPKNRVGTSAHDSSYQ